MVAHTYNPSYPEVGTETITLGDQPSQNSSRDPISTTCYPRYRGGLNRRTAVQDSLGIVGPNWKNS
jgi:hypothetical protein